MQELYDIIRKQQKQWNDIIAKFKKGNGLSDDEIETLYVLRHSEFIDTSTTDWRVMCLMMEIERAYPSVKVYEDVQKDKFIIKEKETDKYFAEYEINGETIVVEKTTRTTKKETMYIILLIDNSNMCEFQIGVVHGIQNLYTVTALINYKECTFECFDRFHLPEGCHNLTRTHLENCITAIYKKYKHI